MNKKIIALLSILILILGITISGCNKEKTSYTKEKPLIIKVATDQQIGHPTTLAIEQMGANVEKKTNGRIKFEIFPAAQLGNDKVTAQSLQMGGIGIATLSSSAGSDIDARFKVFQLPYVISEQQMYKFFNTPAGAEFMDLSDKGMIGLTILNPGARHIWNSKHPVNTPDDVKGLRIRTAPNKIQAMTVQSLGGTAIPVAYAETYDALKSGIVDGVEFHISGVASQSLDEIIKYVTLIGYANAPDYLMMSKKVWDQLSDEDKKIMKEAANEARLFQEEKIKDIEVKSFEKMKAKGLQVIEVKDLTVWQDKTTKIYSDFPEAEVWIKKVKSIN